MPAWCVSICLHALVLVMMLLVVDRTPTGAADEPGRAVGIVLRRADAQGDPYQGEEESIETIQSAQDAAQANAAALATLPEESAESQLADRLPKPLGLGPASLTGTGNASSMTEGGGTPRRTAGGDAGDAVVQVFGVKGTGSKFVYAFDRSVSMNMEGRLSAAKRQLLQSLESLDTVHQFQIVFFNHNPTAPDLSGGQNRIAFATEQNKRLAERFVSGVIADGGTDRYGALVKALALAPDVIFFLTDADDAMTPAEMQRISDRNRRVGATICTIEFGSGPASGRRNFLNVLAEMTGGQYGYIDTTRLPR